MFNGDKIQLQGGNMVFKPLGIETIHELVDEQRASAKKGKPKHLKFHNEVTKTKSQ